MGRAFGPGGGKMRRLALLVVPLVIVASACGESSDPAASPTTPPAAEFPVTVTAANGEVTIEARPERIVSLSPTGTEMLFAIGAGDQVDAVDDQSNFPPEAPASDLSGFEPNVEAISEFDPDLVVVSDDVEDLVASLEALGIPTLVQPAAANLDEAYAEIEVLGEATGNAEGAARVVDGMREDIDAILESVPDTAEPLTYYHELDPTFFSVTSNTFIGQVYSLLGLENIADAAQGASSGYPQLSAEYIVEADPQLIFLADTKCCGQNAQTVSQRAGWEQIRAVRDGGVVELDDSIASRWGPRIVDLLETVVDALGEVAAAA
jgi:iron complex transport system substrate-binding protein